MNYRTWGDTDSLRQKPDPPIRAVVRNYSKKKISLNKTEAIRSLFAYSIDNFAWNRFIKDQPAYYTKEHLGNNKYKIHLPSEKFSLNVFVNKRGRPLKIHVVKK